MKTLNERMVETEKEVEKARLNSLGLNSFKMLKAEFENYYREFKPAPRPLTMK